MARVRALPAKELSRLAAQDWVAIGLQVLAESGIDAVRVESLARKLGITKGSFYWHFGARADLLRAMLLSWRRHATVAIIERQRQTEGNARQRLRQLIDLPIRSRGSPNAAALELAIRLWAKSDPQAAQAVEEVDEVRLAYIRGLLNESGTTAPHECEGQAFLIYAFMLAEAFVSPALSADAKEACDRVLGISAMAQPRDGRIKTLYQVS